MARQATKKTGRRPAAKTAKRPAKSTARKRASKAAGSRSGRSASARRQQQRSPKQLQDLFHETLKDIFHAEKQILRALPKMARNAQSDELRQAFETHRQETEGQVDRLEQVFQIIDARPQAKTCHAIMGLVEEGQEVMEEFADGNALDAGLLAAAQAVEHYEISRYGTLIAWAEELGLNDAVDLLRETLEEEKHTDQLLTDLAESDVNQRAEGAGDEEQQSSRGQSGRMNRQENRDEEEDEES
jgi:ferritin-like metal-binding protein YciE